MTYHGIDVSSWQGTINWSQVAQAGIQFAMVRATFGSQGVDNTFVRNMQQASVNNVPCGAYHYCYATSVSAAKTEAAHFLDVIAPYRLSYPVALDLEDLSLLELGSQELTNIASAFLEEIEKAGYYACLYSNLNWLENYLIASRLSQYDIWLAQWNSKPTYDGNFGMWQYTSTGSVAGISGNVDLDLSYRDYPSIIKSANLNNPDGTKPDPTPNPEQTYTVQTGDTMSGIAQKFGISLQTLLNANPQVTNPGLIYTGQVLTIPSSADPPAPVTQYTVKSGDTMSGIAQKFDVSLQSLLNANPQITNPNLIHTGQVITIPTASSTIPPSTTVQYTVKTGDTMSGIAHQYGISVQTLIHANPQITNPNVICTGQVLTIPQ